MTRSGRTRLARAFRCLALALLAFGAWSCKSTRARAGPSPVRKVERIDLNVTRGQIRAGKDGWLQIDDPVTRAVVNGSDGGAIAVRFRYLGPTRAHRRLAGGQKRQQIALKLRAKDSCNVIYVAWRFTHGAGLMVAVKRNPGQKRHAQCGSRGYRRLGLLPLPPIERGSTHRLSAKLVGDTLRVDVDASEVWRGRLDRAALAASGPAGIRTDNARFELEVRTPLVRALLPRSARSAP